MIVYHQGLKDVVPWNMTVKQLRKLLEPYGTPYRHEMTRAELLAVIEKLRKREQEKDHAGL